MSRENLVEALVQSAKNLGWTEVVSEDTGSTVQLLVSAPGAAEQMVEGAPHRLPKLLKDLGGPENYPARVEYDVPKPSAVGLHEDCEKAGKGMSPCDSNVASLQAARDFYAQKHAAVQVGSQVFVVSGVGCHSGPFRREFTDEDVALEFAQKCQLAAVSKAYAATILVEHQGS